MKIDCTTCGACCAFIFGPHKGNKKPSWTESGCSSLTGYVGKKVFCEVYESRPNSCRQFEVGSYGCLAAREVFFNGNSTQE